MPSIPDGKTAAVVKESQESDSKSRNAPTEIVSDAAENRALNIAALDTPDDPTRPEPDKPAPRQPEQRAEEVQERPAPKPIFDQRRADIVANFRQGRKEETEDPESNESEIRKFAHEGMPPELLRQEEPVIPETPIQQVEDDIADVPDTPAKFKVVVRGKEIELTEEEFRAAAQKALAADSYFDEAKSKAQEANELLRSVREQSQRMGQDTKHSGDRQDTRQQQEVSPEQDGEHHVNPYAKLVETIQVGTPEEAAVELQQAISAAAQVESAKVLERQRLADESARSKKFLKDFQDQHAELANDKRMAAAMEITLYEMQAEDIKSLGIDESHPRFPKTPAEIAQWHLWYRANGYRVRDITTMLNTARDEVMKWKGVGTEQKPVTQKAEPRVEVKVDRAERRATIPQQPVRTVAPKPDAASAQVFSKDRSDVVRQMMLDRGKPRGRALA